jgi:molybdopterin biosynthesis enzyme MoaB
MPMTDARIAQLAKKYRELNAEEKEAKRKKVAIAEKLIAELNRRNTRVIETGGVKVTKVTPEEVRYHFDKIIETFGAAKARRVQKEEVDKDKLAELMTNGVLDPAKVAQCSYLFEKSSYLSIP